MPISDNEILRVHIKSAEQMGLLGNAFGAHFLRPLIESGDEDANKIVSVLYGRLESGKSEFAIAACHSFPVFHTLKRWHKDEEGFNKLLVGRVATLDLEFPELDADCLYRYKDCHGQSWDEAGFTPRRSLQKPQQQKPGFDLIEHATRPHLDGTQVVIVIAKDHFNGEDYFRHQFGRNGAAKTEACFENSNSKAEEIREEITRLGLLPIQQDERYVSILLTSSNSRMREAFANFQAKASQALVCEK